MVSDRNMNQKGFIQIPLLIIIIASIVVASAGTGVILHKQGKLAFLTADISEALKQNEETTKETKQEELQNEQEPTLEVGPIEEKVAQQEISENEIVQQEQKLAEEIKPESEIEPMEEETVKPKSIPEVEEPIIISEADEPIEPEFCDDINCPDCQYCDFDVCVNYCQGADNSCGCMDCVNCDNLDGCSGHNYLDYYCSEISCDYTSKNCSDCSYSCGGYNVEESIENNNCDDGKDNDCNGFIDLADLKCKQLHREDTNLDIIDPLIFNIKTTLLLNSVIVEWMTDKPSLGKINFGGQTICSEEGCENSHSSFHYFFEEDSSYHTNHKVTIDRSLKPASEYKFYIYAIDESDNEAVFYDGKITTDLPVPLPELSGQYNIDIVLTKDKNPYLLTSDVFINKNITIEPGVEIKLNDYKLVINKTLGEIRVNGTKNEPVLFGFDNNSGGIYIRSNNDNIINSTIIDRASEISVDSGQNGVWSNVSIFNSTIATNIWANKSTVKIFNSTITGEVRGVFNSIIEISQSDISGLSFQTGSIPKLKSNNIQGSITIHAHPDLVAAIFTQNNIQGSVSFGSEVTGGIWNHTEGEINAQNNWWGTIDTSTISQHIKEYHDVFFNYQPIATSEISDAGVQ
jgi:hypothetical protein